MEDPSARPIHSPQHLCAIYDIPPSTLSPTLYPLTARDLGELLRRRYLARRRLADLQLILLFATAHAYDFAAAAAAPGDYDPDRMVELCVKTGAMVHDFAAGGAMTGCAVGDFMAKRLSRGRAVRRLARRVRTDYGLRFSNELGDRCLWDHLDGLWRVLVREETSLDFNHWQLIKL